MIDTSTWNLGENTILQSYTFIRQLGGGEGKVYELQHNETKELYILKVIKKMHIWNEDDKKKLLERIKTQYYENWKHFNLINVVKIFRNAKEFLFLTEKAKGVPLIDFII